MPFTDVRRSFVGLASATSANGTPRTGATFDLNAIPKGCGLSVQCVATITTSSVTATFTPQVSMDGTNWYNWKQPQAPAQVAVATGTGSPVSTLTALDIGPGVKAWAYFRCNSVLGGASTDPADVTAVDYRWADGFSVG